MAVEMPVLTEQIADRYATYRTPLLERLARLVGAAEAENLCEDLFLRVLVIGIAAASSDDVAAWLAREALRLARTMRRQRARKRRAGELAAPAWANDTSSAALDGLHVQAVLALFSEEERQLLGQVSDDVRQADIAEALGYSAGALRTQLYRLRLRHRDTTPQEMVTRADGTGAESRAEPLRDRRAAARRQNASDREAKK
jgi:DNA-directed RNA polymerase specialized sigma24 family protein